MFIMTAVVLSTFLFAVTGCAFSSDPSTAKQETGKKESTKKPIKRDQERSMNEESMEAVR
jgi:Flp pilus assembly protein TadD